MSGDEWLLNDGGSGNWKFLRSMVAGFTHRFTPASLHTVTASLGETAVLFRTLNVGVAGRGTSSMLPNYSAYKAEAGLVGYMRKMYLKGLNLTAEDNDWSKTVAGKPVSPGSLNVMLIQKYGKRTTTNMQELAAQLRRAFPEANFTVAAWEDLKAGARGETRILINTHVVVSVDGTGANGNFLVPPGGVFISLGVAAPWGSGRFAGEWAAVGGRLLQTTPAAAAA